MPLNSQCGESQVLSLQAATCGLLLDYQADPLKDKMLQSYIYFMYIFFSYLLFGCWKRNFNMTVTGDSQVAQSINCLPLDCKLRQLVDKIMKSKSGGFRFPHVFAGIFRWQKVRSPAIYKFKGVLTTIVMTQVLRAGEKQPETDWYSEEGPPGVLISSPVTNMLPWGSTIIHRSSTASMVVYGYWWPMAHGIMIDYDDYDLMTWLYRCIYVETVYIMYI